MTGIENGGNEVLGAQLKKLFLLFPYTTIEAFVRRSSLHLLVTTDRYFIKGYFFCEMVQFFEEEKESRENHIDITIDSQKTELGVSI